MARSDAERSEAPCSAKTTNESIYPDQNYDLRSRGAVGKFYLNAVLSSLCALGSTSLAVFCSRRDFVLVMVDAASRCRSILERRACVAPRSSFSGCFTSPAECLAVRSGALSLCAFVLLVLVRSWCRDAVVRRTSTGARSRDLRLFGSHARARLAASGSREL